MNIKTAFIIALLTTTFTAPAHAITNEDLAKKIDDLQQQLNLLKRQQEVAQEVATTDKTKNAKVQFDQKGLQITSPDSRYALKLRGYAQADSRTFFDNSNVNNVDQFVIRSARLVADGTFDQDFATRLSIDFGNGQTRLVDAYADYKPQTWLNFRLGKFKSPVGLERWEGETETEFVERGMATNLVPFRDIGIGLYGDILPQTLEYQLDFFDGTADLADPNSDADKKKDVAARIFAHPFRNSDVIALQGLGFGVAGTYGKHAGNSLASNVTDGYRTPAQAKFFSYRASLTDPTDITVADGTTWRINPQLLYYNGSFGLLAEYVKEKLEVAHLADRVSLDNDAYTVFATYVLTGEDASFDGVKPHDYFSLANGTWGAWEVTARYGQLHADKNAYPIFADPAKAASDAYESTIGLNWYPDDNLKFNLDYAQTRFNGGASGGADRETEKALLARAQFRF